MEKDSGSSKLLFFSDPWFKEVSCISTLSSTDIEYDPDMLLRKIQRRGGKHR
jgi:hypothetical protein